MYLPATDSVPEALPIWYMALIPALAESGTNFA